MEKEDLLIKLRELEGRLKSEGIDDRNLEQRTEEIVELEAKIDANKKDIELYEGMLLEDSNFLDNAPLQYYFMLESQELENLKNMQNQVAQNNFEIERSKSFNENLKADILGMEEIIAKIEVDNTSLNLDIRRARLVKNSEKIEACTKKIADNQSMINDFVAEINSSKGKIQDNEKNLEKLIESAELLKLEEQKAQNKYDGVVAKEKASKNNSIDLAKKNEVETKVEILKATNSALDYRVNELSYDFASKVRGITNDFENAVISEEQLIEKLEEIKAEMQAEFLAEDEQIINTELEDNKRAQEILETKIDDLTKKLANLDNYSHIKTPAEIANIQAKISNSQANIASYDAQVSMLDSQISSGVVDLSQYKALIEIYEIENEDIARQLIINNSVDKELEAELLAKQKSNFTAIAEAKEQLEFIELEGLNNEQILAQLQDRKVRNEKLIASYQAKLAEDNTIDKSSRRLDQRELDSSIQALNALKNREQFLNPSLTKYIDSIIASKVKNDNHDESLPVNEADTKGDNLPVNEDDTKGDNPPVNEDDTKGDNPPVNEDEAKGEDFPPKKDNLGKRLVSGFKDATDKLKDKAKSKGLLSALKKKLKILLYVALLALGLKMGYDDIHKEPIKTIMTDDNALDQIANSPTPAATLNDILKNIPNNHEVKNVNNDNKDGKDGEKNGGQQGKGDGSYAVKNSDKVPTTAPAVDSKDIKDTNSDKEVKQEHHQEPVKPEDIVDEHPENTTPVPTPTNTPTGGATPTDTPTTTPEKPTPTPVVPEGGTNVDGTETVDPGSWDNEQPTVDDGKTSENTTNETTTFAVNPGDALITSNGGNNYVADNNSLTYEAGNNDQSIGQNPDVKSVDFTTDKDGKDVINVTIDDSAKRDHELTQAEVDAIAAQNGVSAQEIAAAEEQFKKQEAAIQALEELKQQISTTPQSVETQEGFSR
jgi:hypothetical protein